MDELAIRDATPGDAEAVAAIYGHHVLHGTASYDLVPPPAEDIRTQTDRVTAAGSPFPPADRARRVVGSSSATHVPPPAPSRLSPRCSRDGWPSSLADRQVSAPR